MELDEKIQKLNPILAIKYKNSLDLFLSLTFFERIIIILILAAYIILLSVLFFAFEDQDRFAIIFSLIITIIAALVFILPKYVKLLKYKIIFGKDKFMLFKYCSSRTSIGYVIHFEYPYSYIKSYSIKPKSILLQIDTDKLGNDVINARCYIGNLSSEEIYLAKEILLKAKTQLRN